MLVKIYKNNNARLFVPVFLSALLIFCIIPAHAQVAPPEKENESILNKMYVGTGLGYSFLDTNIRGNTFTLNKDNDFGGRIFIGLDEKKFLSYELIYSDFGSATLNPAGEVKYQSLGLNVNFYVTEKGKPAHIGYSGVFKAGVESIKMSTSVAEVGTSSSQFTLGMGAEYGWPNGMAIQGSVQTLYKEAGMLSINLLYRFGFDPVLVVLAEPEVNDVDADGVMDELDKCPGTQADRVVDAIGCEFDEDLDGVVDGNDRCPGTPKGMRVNPRGCIFDTDNDGISDQKDLCPTTPSGVTVDSFGCELDSDHDEVKDSQDQCPDTPIGDEVDFRGCGLDEDQDGVVDNRDQCLLTPMGEAVDEKGCTIDGDKDGDSVLDSLDKCPDTVKGASVNSEGCAIFESTLTGINFKLASTDLATDAKIQLNEAAAALLKFPGVRVEIQAHTDSQGTLVNNQRLSEVRANSVADYLESKGVSRDRMEAVGYGESQPLTSNLTVEGRAQNRRVQFRVLDKGETVNASSAALLAPIKFCADVGSNPDDCVDLNVQTEGISFKLASSELTDGAKEILDKAAISLLNYPNVRIEIQAHTDSQGTLENNQNLSNIRAQAVLDYLQSQGVDSSRMVAKGYGELRPKVSNRTPEGRSMNRRVEFSILPADQAVQ